MADKVLITRTDGRSVGRSWLVAVLCFSEHAAVPALYEYRHPIRVSFQAGSDSVDQLSHLAFRLSKRFYEVNFVRKIRVPIIQPSHESLRESFGSNDFWPIEQR